MVDDLQDCNIDSLLNISNHYAVMSYKYTLNVMGLSINEKEVSVSPMYYFSITDLWSMKKLIYKL